MLLWSAVTRDQVVLAECGEDSRGGEVLALAKAILRKKPTPGWEFERRGSLRAIKFFVHSQAETSSSASPTIAWSMCCVHDASLDTKVAKGFLEKIAFMTDPLRETDPVWIRGGTLAAQDSFAPTLLQRMEQANSMGRTAMISSQVNEVKDLMHSNIELLLARGDKLDELEEKATGLAKLSKQFNKQARRAKRFQMWNNAKFGLAVGTAATVATAVVVVPPLVAIL